uniref:N-arachidonyl glycine receptor n=1 Tax=Knipowitschia caucasica TaxID=637954 RepID=A0AAV2K450_KNICA
MAEGTFLKQLNVFPSMDLLGVNMSAESSSEEQAPQEYRVAGLIFFSLIFIIGVAVNLTALSVFALTTKKRNSVTVYMINVALVDLLFITVLPFKVTYLHLDYWPFGDVFCRISAALTIFYPCMALWLFALISADRYMAIVQPRHVKELRNVPKAVLASVGVWLMTLGSTISLVFSLDDPDASSNFTTCVKVIDIIYMRSDNPVNFARLVFFFLLPICVMVGCYMVIVDNLIHGRTSKLKPKVKQKSWPMEGSMAQSVHESAPETIRNHPDAKFFTTII